MSIANKKLNNFIEIHQAVSDLYEKVISQKLSSEYENTELEIIKNYPEYLGLLNKDREFIDGMILGFKKAICFLTIEIIQGEWVWRAEPERVYSK